MTLKSLEINECSHMKSFKISHSLTSNDFRVQKVLKFSSFLPAEKV